MTSKLSDTKIRSETAFWADKVSKLTTKIKNKQTTLQSINSQLSKIDKSLDNTEYNNAKNNYDDLASQADSVSAKLAKSKSKATKNKLSSELNDINSKKSRYAQQMKQIASANGFTSKLNARTRKLRNKKDVTRLISNLKNQRDSALKSQNYYRQTALSRQRTKVMQRNSGIIQQKLSDVKDTGFTTLYRTDMMDDTVFQLIETSPSETVNNDVATKPVDGSTVETNFIAQNSQEYSSTFYIKGDSFADLDAQYKQLKDWSNKYELTINGFSHWTHAYITSLGKSTDATIAGNAMIITITFTYARQAQIKYKQETKSTVSHKAGTKKQSGSRKGQTAKYITVKPGMTYSEIARKTGTSLSDIMSMNKYKSTAIPVGAKVRYV